MSGTGVSSQELLAPLDSGLVSQTLVREPAQVIQTHGKICRCQSSQAVTRYPSSGLNSPCSSRRSAQRYVAVSLSQPARQLRWRVWKPRSRIRRQLAVPKVKSVFVDLASGIWEEKGSKSTGGVLTVESVSCMATCRDLLTQSAREVHGERAVESGCQMRVKLKEVAQSAPGKGECFDVFLRGSCRAG